MMIIMMKIIFLTVNVKIFFLTVKWSVMHGHLCKHRLGDLSHSLPLPLSPHFLGSHCWHPRVLISADIYLNMRILVPARVATVPQICRGMSPKYAEDRWGLAHQCNPQAADRCRCGLVQCRDFSGRARYPLLANQIEIVSFMK